jgi:phage terminase Nu1 subunit (DNA packaging protein)
MEKRMGTIVQIAQALDLSTKMVNDLVARGTITKQPRGQYDVEEATREYVRHIREVAAGRLRAGELDLAEERARLAKEQADAKEMENALLRGDLVEIGGVAKEFGKQASAVRTRLLSIPSKAAPLVISCEKPAEARAIIEDMIEEALNELVGYNPQATDEDA